MKDGLYIKNDFSKSLLGLMKSVNEQYVLVGVPEDKGPRKNANEPTNAELAYIHDNGSPAQNIPPRPFMDPAVSNTKDQVADIFGKAMEKIPLAHTDAGAAVIDKALDKVGLLVSTEIKKVIRDGIDPPLAPASVAMRAANRGAKQMRKSEKEYFNQLSAGKSPAQAQDAAGITPLINTAQMLNSFTYVKKGRK